LFLGLVRKFIRAEKRRTWSIIIQYHDRSVAWTVTLEQTMKAERRGTGKPLLFL